MKKLFLLLLLIPFISPALAKNEVKHAAKTVDRILDVDDRGLDIDKGKGKGKGKPANPGAHGRTNAEIKKASNPGQGGGKNSSLGGALVDELVDDDDKKGGGKDGKKGGKKGGKKK